MSPLSSFKRLSVGSTKSTKSSNFSASVNDHPYPLDITFPLNFQSSLKPSLMLVTSNDDGYAEMLDDDNMSWGTRNPSNPHSKRPKRGPLGLF